MKKNVQCVSNVSICMEYESALDHLMAMHYMRKYINLHFTYDRLTEKTHPPLSFSFSRTHSRWAITFTELENLGH